MLTMGKLACLPAGKRKEYDGLQKQCRRTVKETLEIEGAYAGLDGGYRLKIKLFERFPKLYIGLYGLMKKKAVKERNGQSTEGGEEYFLRLYQ